MGTRLQDIAEHEENSLFVIQSVCMYNLISCIIKQAIVDYARFDLMVNGYFPDYKYAAIRSTIRQDGQDARSFLFRGRRLSEFLCTYNLQGRINIVSLRKYITQLLDRIKSSTKIRHKDITTEVDGLNVFAGLDKNRFRIKEQVNYGKSTTNN